MYTPGCKYCDTRKVAIKYEATTCAQPTLVWESKILNHLSGIPGVVKLRYFGTESNKNIIVMDLFSHTLAEEVRKLKKQHLMQYSIENMKAGQKVKQAIMMK